MMNQQMWLKVEEIFHRALEHPLGAQTEYLDQACKNDPELRGQVELLLLREEEAGSFLETSALQDFTTAHSLLGREFGPYRILSLLGAGGMGEVYRAHDVKLGRDVAIKTLPLAFASDPERLVRFRREARMLASLNHPNIAAVYGLASGGLDGSSEADCLVMELVEGETLRGPVEVEKALDYACQIAEALEAAHAKGIIHRDLKPANVKLTSDDRIKVLDFGLAKAMWGLEGDQGSPETSEMVGSMSLSGRVAGTPGYMSPEQARGSEVDHRSDIWAFGCLLYELLAGKRAFAGTPIEETLAAVLDSEPDWQALPANTPKTVRNLLRGCVHKDIDRRVQHISEVRRTIANAQRGRNRWRGLAIGIGTLAAVTAALAFALRDNPGSSIADRSNWVQLTRLPGSVTQPALSPDGSMLTFVRGNSQFFGAGQIYVKTLPDGVPRQLTHDTVSKMSPSFSADGTRIAYTTVQGFQWDTWVVPSTGGGEPKLWLRNASGLSWAGMGRLVFSEMRTAPHMGLVTSTENREGQRDVYLPEHEHAMAHRSYPSPDGKWVLLVEMDHDHAWGPCRLVPFDGSSQGRKVGPPAAACTFAAWSPDSQWMYFTSEAGGAHHTWRQRFPDGQPEQVTSGPTEEEGIAIAPDGRSFVTAVTLSNIAVWVHDANGERPVATESNTADPRFTPDGSKLCYRVVKQTPNEFRFMGGEPGELWLTVLKSGVTQPMFPGFQIFDYDISVDGKQIVMEGADRDGKPQLWVAAFDGQSPPRQIPNVAGRTPRFGPTGEVFFRSSGFAYRVHPDGSGLRKAIEQPVALLVDVSPDGRWLVAWSAVANKGLAVWAFPIYGGTPPVRVAAAIGGLHFSSDGRAIAVWGGPIAEERSFIVPVPPGRTFPDVPVLGFRLEQEWANLPGARRFDAQGVVPGPSPGVYAFYRGATQRDLYRVTIQ